jgi:adenylosuccinate lyase
VSAKPLIPDVLAARYASGELTRLWSPEHKVVLERQLWLAVLKAQADLGIEVPEGAVAAYERVVDQVDLASIAERERVTRHDVKARIEEFSALAGHEQIHKGMTSRDLTENVEQLQVRLSLEHVRDRTVALLVRLAALASEHSELVMTGRSHNVAAQATTLGKRFASAADEILVAFQRLEELIARYPLRGIKGPVPRVVAWAATRTSSPTWSAGSPGTSASSRASPASARSTRARWTTTCCPRWSSWPPVPAASPRRSG